MRAPGRHLLAIGVVLAAGIILRVIWPLADPPPDLSWSSAIYTDPWSKTLPARNAIQFGQWNREDTPYLLAFPISNGLTWVTYRLFGVGRMPYQMLSVLVSMLGLVALVLAVRRGAGATAALLTAGLGACSYWLAMFARIPVDENFVVAILALAGWFAQGRRPRDLAIAGAVAVTAVFFGKYHAVGFLPALVLFAAFRAKSIRGAIPVVLGGAPVFLAWFFIIFLPHRSELLAYVHRVSTGIHGPLPVTQSPANGLLDIFRSAADAWMFHQMPVAGILGVLFTVWTLGNGAARRRRLADGSALFAFWVASMWLYYSVLSYKTPNYYLVVAYPLAAGAACLLADLWTGGREVRVRTGRRDEIIPLAVFGYALAFILVDIVHHLLSGLLLAERTRHPEATTPLFRRLSAMSDPLSTVEKELACALAVWFIMMAAFAAVIALRRGKHGRARRVPSAAWRPVAAALLAAAVAVDAVQFTRWAADRKYVIEEVKQSLPHLIGHDSIVLGVFAALLTQDSGIAAISYLDPLAPADLIRRYGITHYVTDEKSEELGFETRAAQVVKGSLLLDEWRFRSRYVSFLRLHRIAAASNAPTLYEQAVAGLTGGHWSAARSLLDEERRTIGHDVPEVLFRQAACLYNVGDHAGSLRCLEEARRLRPDNPYYLKALGQVAFEQGRLADARELWKRGLELDPNDLEFIQLIRQPGKVSGR